MNNDAVLTKALNEIARLELINFRQAVTIEQLQNEISIRDQMKGGQNVNDTTNASAEHEQKPSVSEDHND